MSNSPLAKYKKISPNRTSPRNHKIDTITIHCYVGQASVESMASWLCNPSVNASSNYGIGYDGRIGLFVEEKDRSWCSSSSSNDNRAITIECASDQVHPYTINSKVYDSLIDLCTDICKRNGIKELKWKADKSLIGQPDKQNMTVHRWFANKACPGDYIYNRLDKIAAEVNARLKQSSSESKEMKPTTSYPKTPFKVKTLVRTSYYEKPSKEEKILGKISKGTYTIVEVSNGFGKLKSGKGWIWIADPTKCKILDTVNPSSFKRYSVKVDIDDLKIRKGPGSKYEWTGLYTGKGVFTIIDEKNGWGKLKSKVGWIRLDRTKKM